MINPKKVELMTGIAMYEHTRKISLKQNKYFEKKYKAVIALRSIPVGIAIGCLVAFFIFAAEYKDFLSLYYSIGALKFLSASALVILLAAAIYVLISVWVIARRFENMRGSYVKYRLYQRELSKLNEEE